MDKKKIDQIFTRFAAQDPTPKTELYFTNDYTMLVAVVLSAQATDVGVNKATKTLFAKVYTPQQMVKTRRGRLKTIYKNHRPF